MDYKILIKKAHENAIEKGFYGKDEEKNIGELLMLIVSELGEALEAHRRGYFHYKYIPEIKKPENEEWRDIPSHTDYQASNMGQVKSKKRKVWNGKVYYDKDSTLLRPAITSTGYRGVAINRRTKKVADLVAEAFLGDKCKNIVNHINGDKECDWVTNLEYTTYSGNNQHAITTGLRGYNKKLSLFDNLDITHRIKSGERMVDIHKDYPQVTISAIKILKQRGIEKYTDCFEIEIADFFIRIFDLMGYLGVTDDTDFYKCGYWSNPDIKENIGDELMTIVSEVVNLNGTYEEYADPDINGSANFGYIIRRVELLCEKLNINIEKYIDFKMKYNSTRPKKHGKAY